MKAVSRWLDGFCYNHPNFGLPGLMKYVAISNLAVYILDICMVTTDLCLTLRNAKLDKERENAK